MTTKNLNLATTVTAMAATVAVPAAENLSTDDLIAKIKSPDDKTRGPAWQSAGPYGAAAVKPLAEVMTDPDYEIARAAKRALWQIVRHAGRPGAKAEAKAVTAQLAKLLATAGTVVRREVLWMLSEIGGDDAVAPMAALLADNDVHDDARCALQRIPGGKTTAALKKGLTTAPEEFKPALAQSLRVRGVKVDGYPTEKLKPTKQTTVKPSATS